MQDKKLIKSMYFVKFGERTGQFLIFIDFDEETNSYSLLALPESEPVYITKTDIDKALSYKVMEFIEKLPNDVFKDCKKEFKFRAKI